jgi:hypothetical protein
MRIPFLIAFLSLAGSVLLGAPAYAVDVMPSARAESVAAAAGKAMAAHNEAYEIGPYLLFGTNTDVLLTDESPSVEAVQLATAIERIRWMAYVSEMEQRPLPPSTIAAFAKEQRGIISFIVFAHGHDEHDRTFLTAFSGGSLVRAADGTLVASADIERSVATQDQYFMPGNRVVDRYLGQVTYRFTLPVTPNSVMDEPLIFEFNDDRGEAQRFPLTLSHFQ